MNKVKLYTLEMELKKIVEIVILKKPKPKPNVWNQIVKKNLTKSTLSIKFWIKIKILKKNFDIMKKQNLYIQ